MKSRLGSLTGQLPFFWINTHILEETSAHLWNLAASPCQPHRAQISLFCYAPRTGSDGDQLSCSHLSASIPGALVLPLSCQPQKKGLTLPRLLHRSLTSQGCISGSQQLLALHAKALFPRSKHFSCISPNFLELFELVQAPGLILMQHVQMNALSASSTLQFLSHIRCTLVKIQLMLLGRHKHFWSAIAETLGSVGRHRESYTPFFVLNEDESYSLGWIDVWIKSMGCSPANLQGCHFDSISREQNS